MKLEASSIEEFFNACGERETEMRKLDELIRSTAPSLKRQFHSSPSITMIGYGMFEYKTKSGGGGEWPVVAIAPQKNHIGLYICAVKDGKYIAEIYKDKLGKVNTGKSCIRFKKSDDLNLDTVKKILKDIESDIKSGKNPFGFA